MVQIKKGIIITIVGILALVLLTSRNIPQQVIVSAGCSSIADCPTPTKNFCPNFVSGCIQNICVYDMTIQNAVVCTNEVVTMIVQQNITQQREEIPIEDELTFIFSQDYLKRSFNFGDKSFTATEPKYLCQIPIDSDFLNAPNPSSDCWETTATYSGGSFALKDNQKTQLTPYIGLQYFASGTLTRGEFKRDSDWGNVFVFTISPDALQLDVEGGSYIPKDSIKNINIRLFNNLPNGDVIVKTQQIAKQTNKIFPERIISNKVINGYNTFDIPLDTSNYGINQVTIQVFYTINSNTIIYIQSNKFILNYNIVDNIPNVQNPIIVDKVPICNSEVGQLCLTIESKAYTTSCQKDALIKQGYSACQSKEKKDFTMLAIISIILIGLLLLKKIFK